MFNQRVGARRMKGTAVKYRLVSAWFRSGTMCKRSSVVAVKGEEGVCGMKRMKNGVEQSLSQLLILEE